LRIFSLKRPAEAVFHAQTKLVRSPIIYLPEKIYSAAWRGLLGQFHTWFKFRRAWWRALRHAVRGARARGDAGAMLAFCQACSLIRELRGIRHLHAHYANVPAKVALIVHRITGASYSITTHAKDIFQNDPFASPKLQERMGRALFVVANSRFSTSQIRAGLGGQGEIHTVHNGLDLGAFPMRKSEPVEPLILSVGRLVEKKGFGDLIAACQLLKERKVKFTCELIGTGQLSSALKERIRSCGVGGCVKMTGPLPQEVLREHYERAMVFALPCVQAADGDRDILPNVVKEAMAVGVPVVTTQLDGIEELIEDGVSGLLAPPGDAPALAAKLELLLNDSRLRQDLATQGRKVIEERFDRRANVAQLKKLLMDAMQSPVVDFVESTEATIQSA
jgi:glycosyltransferase involved in cell wall biosynthesis